jgi:hypothetical protein
MVESKMFYLFAGFCSGVALTGFVLTLVVS